MFVDEPVVADVLDASIEFIVLGDVVGAVERLGNRILVGGSGFARCELGGSSAASSSTPALNVV